MKAKKESMLMKSFSLAIALFLISNLAAQDIRVMIKGKKVGKATISEKPVVLKIKKSEYKNIASVTCVVLQNINEVFKRSIGVTDSSGNNLYRVNESAKKGWYIINLATLRSQVLQLKMIKVFLNEDPVNDRMAIRSSMKLLAEIYIQ